VKKTSAALLAVPLVASMLLSGCGGSDELDASHSSTATSSPTSTAPPTTSAPTTSTASPTTDPNIPAAARAHTTAGAEAFVRYFYSQLNAAWSKPQGGLISSLSATTCKTCAALEGSAVDLASRHQRYQGEVFAVGTVGAIGKSEILVAGEQPPGAVVDIKGSVVRRKATAQKAKFIVSVAWSSGGWRVHEIKVSK
jgi:Family of unknown function (DUF6318)